MVGLGFCVEKTVKPRPRVDTLFSAQENKSFPQFPANVSITLSLWMRAFDFKERKSFISVTQQRGFLPFSNEAFTDQIFLSFS